MDPYLERPALWPDVHLELISGLRAQLNAKLRPKYHVRAEDRVYISDEEDPGREVIVPDLRVVTAERREAPLFFPASDARLDVAEPVVVTTLLDDEIHEPRLEVVDSESQLVVTVIEVLSPTNKVAGSRGRQSFLRKRKEVMDSPSHWVEIDLLRKGLPLVAREIYPPCEYLVHVSRKAERPRGVIWPIRLSQGLPTVAIPLRPDDPDVPLDLQSSLDAAYDRAGYDLAIDYGKEPVPPLDGQWVEWTDRLLKEKGLRSI
jgi:Protein of unknown function (DUF4058)